MSFCKRRYSAINNFNKQKFSEVIRKAAHSNDLIMQIAGGSFPVNRINDRQGDEQRKDKIVKRRKKVFDMPVQY